MTKDEQIEDLELRLWVVLATSHGHDEVGELIRVVYEPRGVRAVATLPLFDLRHQIPADILPAVRSARNKWKEAEKA